MAYSTSLFAQILQTIDKNSFIRAVRATNSERGAKGFSSWEQAVAMLFCQLAQSKSLREITDGLRVTCGKLNHLGLTQAPARSTEIDPSGLKARKLNSDELSKLNCALRLMRIAGWYDAVDDLEGWLKEGKVLYDPDETTAYRGDFPYAIYLSKDNFPPLEWGTSQYEHCACPFECIRLATTLIHERRHMHQRLIRPSEGPAYGDGHKFLRDLAGVYGSKSDCGKDVLAYDSSYGSSK